MTPPTALESSALAVEAPADTSDDIFGPSRSFPPRTNRPKPSMISAKLRAKEERKKVIQICTEKLEKMKDPDRNLRRSVCISNTYYKLQDEVRKEKQMKHTMHNNNNNNGSRCDDVRMRSDRIRAPTPNAEQKQRMLDKALESIDKELSAIDANMPPSEVMPEDMTIVSATAGDVLPGYTPSCLLAEQSLTMDHMSYNSRCRSRKRSFDEVEDCDVHEVLSQFYMPPTPRLISAIDDDVLLNVVDDDPIDHKATTSQSTSTTTTTTTTTATTERRHLSVAIADTGGGAKKLKLTVEDDFDKMLELDTDLNQNKSDFHTLNDFHTAVEQPLPKRFRYESSIGDYGISLDFRTSDFHHHHHHHDMMGLDERYQKSRNGGKSEFEIILDALRLDDTKEVCEREDLMYFCSKGGTGTCGDKLVNGDGGDLRSRFGNVADSCGQAAILGDQQAAGFHGLLASLET